MDTRARLTRELLVLVLVAAIATAPVFLFAEGWSRLHVLRVLASNGVTALICGTLLAVLRRGHVAWVARGLVFGLLALVTTLAWTNGESVHVNVVNFVFVTVLASVLLGRGTLLAVATLAALALIGIAFKQPVASAGEAALDARLEAIGQFLPTYGVIVVILWLRERASVTYIDFLRTERSTRPNS